MSTPFTSGDLTSQQARQLNEMMRTVEQFNRLSVAVPLNLSRASGIPIISAPGLGESEILLAEITGNDGATPPVHTAKEKTRDTSNFVVDMVPPRIFTQVLNPLETVIPTGALVAIFPVDGFPDWWWAIPFDEVANNIADCGIGCGWWSGMLDAWCAQITVLSAAGECSSLDTTQTFEMRSVGAGVWQSQKWDDGTVAWVTANFVYPGGSGVVELTIDATGPRLTINAKELIRDCCARGTAQFSGGSQQDTLCNGTPPDPCSDNMFRVRIVCECCSIDGWEGPGWYCVDTGGGCPGEPVFLIDSDRCDTDITICSGPYATEADAQVDCPGTATVDTACCPDDPMLVNLTLTFAGCTGIYTALNTTTVPIVYDSGLGYWTTGVIDFGAVCGNCDFGNSTGEIQLKCDATTWKGFIKVDEACTPASSFQSSGPVSNDCAANTFTGFTFSNSCTGIAGTLGWNIAP